MHVCSGRLCWANPWTSLSVSMKWSVDKEKGVGKIYLHFERPLTAAIKKLSSHWLKVKELLLLKKREGINFHQGSVFIIAKS